MNLVTRAVRGSMVGLGLSVLLVPLAAGSAEAAPAPAPTPVTVPPCSTTSPSAMVAGSYIQPGGCLVSPDQQYELNMQADGNLVLYFMSQSDPLWNSNTAGQAGAYATLQTSGNLIVNGPPGLLWQSATAGTPDATLVLQDDGNLVIYGKGAGGSLYAAWSSKTENLLGHRLPSGQVLQPTQSLMSENGTYLLDMSQTGYLVLTQGGSYHCPLWSEPAVVDQNPVQGDPPFSTYSPQNLVFTYAGDGDPVAGQPSGATAATATPDAYLAMQTDGNLVLYPQGTGLGALWATGTDGSSGAYLTVQTDGNVVVYSASGSPVWQSRTNAFRGGELCTDDTLQIGQYLGFSSAGGRSGPTLTLQGTCNLVLYQTLSNGSRTAIWSSDTDKTATSFSGKSTDLKQLSTTGNFSGCYLAMQDDGNLVIYAPNYAGGQQAMWSSGSGVGSNQPPTGRPYIGPFWLQIFNPYLLLERWGVGTGWKADPKDQATRIDATADAGTGARATSLIGSINTDLTSTTLDDLEDVFEAFGWV